MQICGHKTRSVFDRYNIVSATDLKEAAKRIEQAIATSAVPPVQPSQGSILASNGYPNGYPAAGAELSSPKGSASVLDLFEVGEWAGAELNRRHEDFQTQNNK
jgi:hypothetical protein